MATRWSMTRRCWSATVGFWWATAAAGAAIGSCVSMATSVQRVPRWQTTARTRQWRRPSDEHRNHGQASPVGRSAHGLKDREDPVDTIASAGAGRFGAYGGRFVPETLMPAV